MSTSDNGSNVKSALQKDFGIWCSCFCHNFNLILKPFFKQEKDESDRSINNYVDTSDDETANFYQRKERSSLSAKNLKFSMILPQEDKLKQLNFIK